MSGFGGSMTGAQANPTAYDNLLSGMGMQPTNDFRMQNPMAQKQGGFDLKGPLAQMAMGQLMSKINPPQHPPMQPPQHVLGLQIPRRYG